jgi:ParB/RepB/Spo0J family partition protein
MPLDTAAHTAPHTQTLPLDRIVVSSTHVQALRRQRYNPAAMDELADSLRRLGQLQPIVVRPHRGPDQWEIVAGERRFLAARQAGMQTIEASVRDLDDAQVIEAQVTENLQREDLHPIEEAEGYEELRRTAGLSIDDLVAKVGKSRRWVFGRLKLLDLTPAARAAFLSGEINASVALELASVSHAPMQDEALHAIREEAQYDDRPMSVRDVRYLLRNKFLLRLARAPFPTDDGLLIVTAGACTTCPKRSGNQPELFGEPDDEDLCTDSKCFADKRAAHTERLLQRAREAGQVVIEGKAAKKIKPREHHDLQGYTPLDTAGWNVGIPGNKTLRQLLQPDPPPPALLVDPHSGEVIEILRDDEVQRQLKARGLLAGKVKRAAAADDEDGESAGLSRSAQDKARADKAAFETTLRTETWLRVREKLAAGAPTLEDWRMVAGAFYGDVWAEYQKRICKRWGWDYTRDVAKHIATLSAEQVALFCMDCALVKEVHVGPYNVSKLEILAAAAERHGVDVAAIRRELAAEKKAKATRSKT